MDESILYDLICDRTMCKWRDEVTKVNCNLKKQLEEQKNLLLAAIDESNRNLVKHFELAADNYWSYVYYCVDIKLINICIKIGMELQKFYDDFEE